MKSWAESAIRELERLAEECESAGDYEGAEEHLRQCIAMRRVMRGSNQRELIDPLYNLGLVCWAQDRAMEARSYLEEAYTLSCKNFGRNSKDALEIRQVVLLLADEPILERMLESTGAA